MNEHRFPFRFDPWARVPLALLGIREDTSGVVVDDGVLDARFGRWRVRTPLANVAGTCRTGPYRLHRVVGPRLSLADRGLTFGTSTQEGVCVLFHEPVVGLLGQRVRHPGLTVTVADPAGLVEAIRSRSG